MIGKRRLGALKLCQGRPQSPSAGEKKPMPRLRIRIVRLHCSTPSPTLTALAFGERCRETVRVRTQWPRLASAALSWPLFILERPLMPRRFAWL
jgi:hypothetical protein